MSDATISDDLGAATASREVGVALRSAVTLGLSLGVTLAVAFAVRFWMPRFLGPDEFGKLVFAEEFAAVFFVFVTLGTETYIRKEVAVRPEHASDFLGSLTVVRLGVSLLVAAIMGVSLSWMGKSPIEWRLVYVFAAGQFFFVLNTSLGSVLQAVGKVRSLAWVNAVSKIVWGAGIVVGLLSGLGLLVVATLFLVTEASKVPFLLRAAHRHTGLKMTLNAGASRAIIIASLPYFLNFVAHRIYAKVDITLLSVLTDDAEVGWYGAAANVTFLIYLILPVLNAVILPMGSRIAKESAEAMHETMRAAVRVVLMVSVPVAIIIALNAQSLVALLFTSSFTPTVYILQMIAPMVPLTYVCVLLSTHLIQVGRIWRVVSNSVIALLLNPTLNLLLIVPGHDLLGDGGGGTAAAFSTVVTECVSATLLLLALGNTAVDRKLGQLSWRLAVCCVVAVVAHHFLRPLGIYSIPIEVAIYVVVASALGALPLGDILRRLRSTLARRKRAASLVATGLKP
jgi:O-antigen/teichoic acid export membrane protein